MKKGYLILAVALSIVGPANLMAQSGSRTLARLIWQDKEQQSLRWGDVKKGQQWSIKAESISGHPDLDEDRHMFVQMQRVGTTAIVGVRDDDNGEFQSGWMALDSGVTQEAHGDHFHWRYKAAPRIIQTKLDKDQGNPAHVYLYEGKYYIANDKKNGFTVVSPSLLGASGAQPDQFFEAGGGHITLAALGGQVAYATWIDRDGDNLGRVDVIGLGSNAGRKYQIHLPSGGIHGATTNSGKVFFAPSDGICWVQADTSVSANEDTVDVHHLSLGESEDGTPLRTGAFTNLDNWVLFSVGGSTEPKLCMINAASSKPSLTKMDLSIKTGNRLTTPKTVRSRTGEKFALMFEESQSGEQDEFLHVIALDPNRDGGFSDAKLHKSVSIGKSLIEGHSGHHEVVALSKRLIAVSNPGDGTIAIISTSNWETEATLNVGGIPTRLLAFGG